MTGFLLDTNHVSGIIRHQGNLAARRRANVDAELIVSMPSVGELWYMVLNSARVDANTVVLERVLADLQILNFDGDAAREFGRVKSELRRLGRPMPDVDSQIAAIARLHGLTLLTADAHFWHVPGLRTENWLN